MAKVKMIPDETLDEIIRKKHVLSPTRVCVKLKDREFSKMIMEARGSASNPLSNSEISEKFRICAGRILPEEKTEKALNLISSLESTQDITTLTEILAG